MKATPWFLPGAALLLGSGWIAMQKNSAAEIRREITMIHERIRQVRSLAESDAPKQAAKTEKSKRVDWKEIAVKMHDSHDGGMPDMRAMLQLHRVLMDLSAVELCEQMDEIAALDIAGDARDQVLSMVMDMLIEKDPKMALERMIAAPEMNLFGPWPAGNAMRKWAEKDSLAAAAWLDQQIAAGHFESKSLDGGNSPLVSMELSLAGVLMLYNPAAVTARVKALNDTQRQEFFAQALRYPMKKGAEADYAKLARDTMPSEKADAILADFAGKLSRHMDFERVDAFIVSSNASAGEKQGMVAKVFETLRVEATEGKINVEGLEKLRAWGVKHSPAAVDRATGQAIAQSIKRIEDFESASSLAVQYNEAAGNDLTLAAFLKNGQIRRVHAQKAAALIPKIKDPALRAEISGLKEYSTPTSKP